MNQFLHKNEIIHSASSKISFMNASKAVRPERRMRCFFLRFITHLQLLFNCSRVAHIIRNINYQIKLKIDLNKKSIENDKNEVIQSKRGSI